MFQIKSRSFAVLVSIAFFALAFALAPAARAADFETVLAQRLSRAPKTVLVDGRQVRQTGVAIDEICDTSNPVARRVFSEYGAMFVGRADVFAGYAQALTGGSLRFLANCVFQNEAEVALYQGNVKTKRATIGGTAVELQADAMDALERAIEEARARNLRITPRGGATASRRSYRQTVELWNSRFLPGLAHHARQGRISAREAETVRQAPIMTQVEKVLAWEEKGFYFSKDLSKSILYSVAAPGASQHIFMLALDVAEFASPEVRSILARHGWFQTVLSDQPHFTYLGLDETELPRHGLVARR